MENKTNKNLELNPLNSESDDTGIPEYTQPKQELPVDTFLPGEQFAKISGDFGSCEVHFTNSTPSEASGLVVYLLERRLELMGNKSKPGYTE